MDTKRFFLYFIVIAALALAGCGGNGGTVMDPTDDDDDDDVMQCPSGTTGTYPDCTPIPPPPTNDSFPGTNMEAAMAIFLPTKAGDAGTLNDSRRPTTSVSVAAGGNTGVTTVDGDVLNKDDDGIKDAEEFAPVADAVRADLSDFSNVMVQSRTVETKTDTVTIYSDVKSLAHEKYLMYFADTNAGSAAQNRPALISAMNAGADPTAAPPDLTGQGILTIDDDTTNAATDPIAIASKYASLFQSAAFPMAQDQTYTYENDDPAQTGDQSKRGGRTLEGSFAGVDGKFVCASTVATGGCTAKTDSKGILSALTGAWTFVPDDVKGYVRNVVPDLDFLSFGYWLQTTEEGGETKYGVSTFYSGSMAFPVGDGTAGIQTLVGSATYTGEATGFYVKKTFDSGANDFVSSSSGQFTADAELTARFGGGEFGNASDYEIDGTVDNFRDEGGDMIDSNWSVELMDAPFGDDGAGNSDTATASAWTNTFSGATSTGTGSTPGEWEGGLFGPANTEDATTDLLEAEKAYPTGVAGEFNAHFSPGGGQDPGHVIGAFGATR